jgi:lipopolysaccharide biosynthesis glycosyltransferase
MNEEIIKVFIGYDPVESIAWHTMANSILEKSSRPVALIPINVRNLKNLYIRGKANEQSNEFSFARFLVPYLMDFNGYAIFFDCDMMLRVDIASIFDGIDRNLDKAVYVVKHNYEPKDKIKYLNTVQYTYPRKNWSSVVLWNCGHPLNKKVTPEFVNTASPQQLHRFLWLDDSDIGELDIRWNWLVGEYENPPSDVKNVHWTVGGPYFNEYKNVDFSEEWNKQFYNMIYCKQRDEA